MAKPGELLATMILFRHGHRTPVHSFPNLPCKITEDFGIGQLTKEGSREMYQRGQFLRLKYSSLFPKDGFFRNRNMKITSSTADRCIMSLQSFMAGFFPPPEDSKVLPINFQPYPMRLDYQARIVTPILNANDVVNAKLYWKALQESPFNQWFEEDKEIIQDLSIRAGGPLKRLVDFVYLTDLINVLDEIGEPVPDWAMAAYKTILPKYVAFFFRIYHANREMQKIRAGGLITELVENMTNVASGNGMGKEILIYSAHDMNIHSLAYALKVEDQLPEFVVYGDTIMVDLIAGKEKEEPQVEVTYFSTANGSMKTFPMRLPGCLEGCSLSVFKKCTEDLLVTDLGPEVKAIL